MSDTPTPAEPSPTESAGLAARYRALPMWARVLIPVAAVALIVLLIVLIGGGGDDSSSSDTTVAESELDSVLKGLIIVGVQPSTTTTSSTTTTTSSTTTTLPATTTAAATTTSAATTVPGTTPATTAAPATTNPPATTAAPTTAAPTTAAPTTAAPTTAAPTTTQPPAPAPMPSVSTFVEQWNAARSSTNVPAIDASQATELTGEYAGYFLVTLPPVEGPRLPPQVGLVAKLTAPGSGQLAQVSLVWIDGAAEDSSEFYWEAFGVLTRALTPQITDAQQATLEADLGRAPGMPPFTTTASATSLGRQYQLFVAPATGTSGGTRPSVITVT